MDKTYKNYLQSKDWKDRKEDFFKKTKQRCAICHRKNCQFHVHHKRYQRKGEDLLGKEKDSDLLLLCAGCHHKLHKFKLEYALCARPIKRTVLAKAFRSGDPLNYIEVYLSMPKKIKVKKQKKQIKQKIKVIINKESFYRELYQMDNHIRSL